MGSPPPQSLLLNLQFHAMTRQPPSSNRIPRAQLALMAALHGVSLVAWGLHLYARTLTPTIGSIPEPGEAEAHWWGVWPATYAPAWVIWLGTAALLATVLGAWVQVRRRAHISEETRPPPSPNLQSSIFNLLTLLLLVAFFLFPIVHTRWGDAYMLTYGIAWPDPALRLVYSWQAPLDVLLHAQFWRMIGEPRGWETATPVYRILSPLAGGIYLLVVLALSRDRRLAPGWLTYGLLVTLGLIQLFFGYVENYSFAAAGVLAYLWLGLGVLRGKRPLWLAATVLAVTNATHPSTVVLAPSLLYLGWTVYRVRWTETADSSASHPDPKNLRNPRFIPESVGNKSRAAIVFQVVLQIGLPMLLVAGGVITIMTAGGHGVQAMLTSDRPGGGDARWFVPLFATTTRWEQYVMFSWAHLRDALNEQMLVAPVVGGSLIVMGIYYSGLKIKNWAAGTAAPPDVQTSRNSIFNLQSSIFNFLLLATLTYLLFIWVWNPDYGGQRDWDLFSLAALPMTLLLIALLPRALNRGRLLAGAAAPLILVQGMHTVLWIFQNTRPWEWPK